MRDGGEGFSWCVRRDGGVAFFNNGGKQNLNATDVVEGFPSKGTGRKLEQKNVFKLTGCKGREDSERKESN